MAQAVGRKVILFVHVQSTPASVYAGSEYRWHEDNFESQMQQGLSLLSSA